MTNFMFVFFLAELRLESSFCKAKPHLGFFCSNPSSYPLKQKSPTHQHGAILLDTDVGRALSGVYLMFHAGAKVVGGFIFLVDTFAHWACLVASVA